MVIPVRVQNDPRRTQDGLFGQSAGNVVISALPEMNVKGGQRVCACVCWKVDGGLQLSLSGRGIRLVPLRARSSFSLSPGVCEAVAMKTATGPAGGNWTRTRRPG